MERAPQLISFVRHVLISVDDIQSQKSLRTHQRQATAPVLPGSGDLCNSVAGHTAGIRLASWSSGRSSVGSVAGEPGQPSLPGRPPESLDPATPPSFRGVCTPGFCFVWHGWVPWLACSLTICICWVSSDTPRYWRLMPTSLKVRWPNTYEVFFCLDFFTGLLEIDIL